MGKHTPGPWTATKFNPATGEIDDCYLYVEPGISVIERKVKGRDQHDTANARLIAAAPDLLEALELADAALSGANMNMNVVERKVKAAIARARGEE